MLKKLDWPTVVDWRRRGIPDAEIAELLGVSVDEVRQANLPMKLASYSPLPDEIRQRAAEVRSQWSDAEHHRRMVQPVVRVETSFIRVRDCSQ